MPPKQASPAASSAQLKRKASRSPAAKKIARTSKSPAPTSTSQKDVAQYMVKSPALAPQTSAKISPPSPHVASSLGVGSSSNAPAAASSAAASAHDVAVNLNSTTAGRGSSSPPPAPTPSRTQILLEKLRASRNASPAAAIFSTTLSNAIAAVGGSSSFQPSTQGKVEGSKKTEDLQHRERLKEVAAIELNKPPEDSSTSQPKKVDEDEKLRRTISSTNINLTASTTSKVLEQGLVDEKPEARPEHDQPSPPPTCTSSSSAAAEVVKNAASEQSPLRPAIGSSPPGGPPATGASSSQAEPSSLFRRRVSEIARARVSLGPNASQEEKKAEEERLAAIERNMEAIFRKPREGSKGPVITADDDDGRIIGVEDANGRIRKPLDTSTTEELGKIHKILQRKLRRSEPAAIQARVDRALRRQSKTPPVRKSYCSCGECPAAPLLPRSQLLEWLRENEKKKAICASTKDQMMKMSDAEDDGGTANTRSGNYPDVAVAGGASSSSSGGLALDDTLALASKRRRTSTTGGGGVSGALGSQVEEQALQEDPLLCSEVAPPADVET
ncbi:unnamed protein product [Amoebophrya sp. A25]|nr:unnamed protein product [Amoebophrya sp. A25]|eukprot:GSA25T00007095001.1